MPDGQANLNNVDLTSTGSTLRVNGLREIATVLDSSARLIAAQVACCFASQVTPNSRVNQKTLLTNSSASLLSR